MRKKAEIDEGYRTAINIKYAPSLDKDLERMINELPKNASVGDLCDVLDEWERKKIAEYKEAERTAKSCRLHPHCRAYATT